jgi:hypothetical protein
MIMTLCDAIDISPRHVLYDLIDNDCDWHETKNVLLQLARMMQREIDTWDDNMRLCGNHVWFDNKGGNINQQFINSCMQGDMPDLCYETNATVYNTIIATEYNHGVIMKIFEGHGDQYEAGMFLFQAYDYKHKKMAHCMLQHIIWKTAWLHHDDESQMPDDWRL